MVTFKYFNQLIFNMVTLYGKVKTGVGDFSKRMEQISGLLEAYFKKTGMHFVPGTLNVELEKEYSLPRDKIIRLEAEEYHGTVSVNIVPCKFNGKDAFILRTDANEAGTGDHKKTIIEIASDVMLRDKFNLKDGDKVTIECEE
jgi:riboflavin kinase, archaea type